MPKGIESLFILCWVSGKVVSRYKAKVNVGVQDTPTLSLRPASHRGQWPTLLCRVERQGRSVPTSLVVLKLKGKGEEGLTPLVALR